jgi:hypothetical protein
MKTLVLTLTSDDDVGPSLDNDLNVVFKYTLPLLSRSPWQSEGLTYARRPAVNRTSTS